MTIDNSEDNGWEEDGDEGDCEGDEEGGEGGSGRVEGAGVPHCRGHRQEEGRQAGDAGDGPHRADESGRDGSGHVMVVAEGPEDGQVLVPGHQQGGEEGEGGDHLADCLAEQTLCSCLGRLHCVKGCKGEEEKGGGDVDQQEVDDQGVGSGAEGLLAGKDHEKGEVDGEGEDHGEGEEGEVGAEQLASRLGEPLQRAVPLLHQAHAVLLLVSFPPTVTCDVSLTCIFSPQIHLSLRLEDGCSF